MLVINIPIVVAILQAIQLPLSLVDIIQIHITISKDSIWEE